MATAIEPRLLADIGSKYARFALEREPRVYQHRKALLCADYPDFLAALRAYLGMVDARGVRHGAIAISNPVEGDLVQMMNYPWRFSIEETRRAVGFETLLVVNDFTALAMGLPQLEPAQYRQVGEGRAVERSVIGIIGAGTGLGVSGLIPVDEGWVSLASEGGHAAFAPASEREVDILRHAQRRFDHVSTERLVSAAGLALIHEVLCLRAGEPVQPREAPEIARLGLAGECRRCAEALEVFCEALGTIAADVALTLGATGGIYIAGGIVPRLGTWFDRSGFRARFESKGRLGRYVAQIPTFVVTAETTTFTGTSAILSAQLRKSGAGSILLERVRRARAGLSQAERRVADYVLAQPRSALGDPIMDIARQAGVSQPTVVRFCRSLGCEGLSDFKLKLASGLTGTIPVSHSLVRREDSALELSAKVLDNTAAALLQTRSQLSSEAVERAIKACLAARRIECYAIGNYAMVALDAQFKFLRCGLQAGACTDPHLLALSAQNLAAGDVVVAISGSGRNADLLRAVEVAQQRGATVITIAPAQAPLARAATIAIAIDHHEDVPAQVPMISRILFLAVIDILAVGIDLRRGAGGAGGTGEGGIEGVAADGRLPEIPLASSHSV